MHGHISTSLDSSSDFHLHPMVHTTLRASLLHSAVFLTHGFRAARMSVIFSIIRFSEHTVSKVHRRIIYLTAVSFACMWTAVLAEKLDSCHIDSCRMGKPTALLQLISEYSCALYGCYDVQVSFPQRTSSRTLRSLLCQCTSTKTRNSSVAEKY